MGHPDDSSEVLLPLRIGAAACRALGLSPDSHNARHRRLGPGLRPIGGLRHALSRRRRLSLFPDPGQGARTWPSCSVSSSSSPALPRTPMVARFAHLGGMVTGYVYIRWWWVIKIKRGLGAACRKICPGGPAAFAERSSRAKSGGLPRARPFGHDGRGRPHPRQDPGPAALSP